MSVKILCIGDAHLGRNPGNFPDELDLDSTTLGPREALRRAVDKAVELRVDELVPVMLSKKMKKYG